MMGAGETVRALDRRGFLGAGSSSEDEGGGRARFFLAFTGTGDSESEGGAVGCFFGRGGLGTTLGLFGAPFGLPLFFTTMGSGATTALSSVSTMGTSSIILY